MQHSHDFLQCDLNTNKHTSDNAGLKHTEN